MRCASAPPCPLEVLQRFTWYGTPREIGDLFRLHKNRREARAVILSHMFGWEVRLLRLEFRVVQIVQTQVCQPERGMSTGEQWKAAMHEKGWGRRPG